MASIDISFDTRSDCAGLDPDRHSATLRDYHRRLWSKPLLSGQVFTLADSTRDAYLHHLSPAGEFWLSSDSIIHTYSYWESMQPLMQELDPEEISSFELLACTIGGYTVFPGNKIDGKVTINGARGMNRTISDRFDLTLECVRRHYAGGTSPLETVLERYADFFALFGSFAGYTDFFLFQDLVHPGTGEVRFFLPFNDFAPPAVPTDVGSYRRYRTAAMDFVQGRNARIAASN